MPEGIESAREMATGGRQRRADIQAMRAIAVALVLVFHVWPRLLPGGFVGVDLFFVISGFLITKNILGELRTTSRVDLVEFWSRRVKRLFPTALTVLLFVIAATLLWVPNVLWDEFSKQVAGSALYVQNWLLASNAVGYTTSQNLASPVQHYWTLAVEEQFYIGLPILVAATARLRRAGERPLQLVLLCATVASLAWSVWFTSVSRSAAYFVTTTRVWEFGVGALLVWAPSLRRRGPATALFTSGAIAAVAAALVIDPTWQFPSIGAAWPVAAAAAMLLGGEALTDPLRRLVGLRPVQHLGDVSYALYLWHWPLVVLLPFATKHALTNWERLGVVSVSLLAASLTTRFVERPVRTSLRVPGGSHRPHAALLWFGSAAILVAATASIALRVDTQRNSEVVSAVDQAGDGTQTCAGALAGLNRTRCGESITAIVPDPVSASKDAQERLECYTNEVTPSFNVCNVGPAAGTLRMLFVGDSHNNMYLPAYERVAAARNWTIDVAGHSSCYWSDAVTPNQAKAIYTKICEEWKDGLERHLAKSEPYDVILAVKANSTNLPLAAGSLDPYAVAINGLVSAWQRQIERGARIVALHDIPTQRPDLLACISTHMLEANTQCSTPRKSARLGPDPLLDAAALAKVPVVDLTDIFCNATTCFPVIGDVLAYQNSDHLTTTFVKTMDTILAERIAAALGLE